MTDSATDTTPWPRMFGMVLTAGIDAFHDETLRGMLLRQALDSLAINHTPPGVTLSDAYTARWSFAKMVPRTPTPDEPWDTELVECTVDDATLVRVMVERSEA